MNIHSASVPKGGEQELEETSVRPLFIEDLLLTHSPAKSTDIIEDIRELITPLRTYSEDYTILGLQELTIISEVSPHKFITILLLVFDKRHFGYNTIATLQLSRKCFFQFLVSYIRVFAQLHFHRSIHKLSLVIRSLTIQAKHGSLAFLLGRRGSVVANIDVTIIIPDG